MIGCMGGHQGGPTSELSIDLYDVNRQLRSGKTRKGKDLIEVPGGRAKLEVQKQIILSTMKETQNNRRLSGRVNVIEDHGSAAVGDTASDEESLHSLAARLHKKSGRLRYDRGRTRGGVVRTGITKKSKVLTKSLSAGLISGPSALHSSSTATLGSHSSSVLGRIEPPLLGVGQSNENVSSQLRAVVVRKLRCIFAADSFAPCLDHGRRSMRSLTMDNGRKLEHSLFARLGSDGRAYKLQARALVSNLGVPDCTLVRRLRLGELSSDDVVCYGSDMLASDSLRVRRQLELDRYFREEVCFK